MDGDASLEGVHNHVPLEDALRAVTHEVKVEAVASEFVQLSTILGSGVSDVHHAVPCCIPISLGHYLGVQPLTSGKEVIVVPSDEHGPLQIHDLSSHLQPPAGNIPEAAPMLVTQRLPKVQHLHSHGPCARLDGIGRGIALTQEVGGARPRLIASQSGHYVAVVAHFLVGRSTREAAPAAVLGARLVMHVGGQDLALSGGASLFDIRHARTTGRLWTRGGNGRNGVHTGLSTGGGSHTDAVSRSPAHPLWIVLQVQLR
mmetsp:Transcript_100522/g.293012  ORF Transcript_100522/g.293012 Transcript_100522/m.293012 type:complete len:258 (+) Transcript_100522:2506-3279(+)